MLGLWTGRLATWSDPSRIGIPSLPNYCSALTITQGRRGSLFSVTQVSGEKQRKHSADHKLHGNHRRNTHHLHVRRRPSHRRGLPLGNLFFGIAFLLPVAESVPHYFLEGHGCQLTEKATHWGVQMKIHSDALHGNIYIAQNQTLLFECPEEYGIIVQMNATANHALWTESKLCPNTYTRTKYDAIPIKPSTFPVKVEYMCAIHGARHWHAGAFAVDEAGKVRPSQYFATSIFAGAYSDSNHYRSMQYSALAIIMAGLIAVLSVMLPQNSVYRKISSFLALALVFSAFVGLVISVSQIRKALPRPYSGRLAHATLGYITLVIIPITLLLGAIQFYTSRLRLLFKITVTLMFIMTISTASIALEGFYKVDQGFVISVALILAILFVSAMLINTTATQITEDVKETLESANPLLEKAMPAASLDRTTGKRKRRVYF